MNKKNPAKWVVEAFYCSGLGLSIVFSVFVGLFFGLCLDKVMSTSPVMMFVFLFLGVVAGFRNLALVIKKTEKSEFLG